MHQLLANQDIAGRSHPLTIEIPASMLVFSFGLVVLLAGFGSVGFWLRDVSLALNFFGASVIGSFKNLILHRLHQSY